MACPRVILTTAHLIISAQEAIVDGRLGIQRGAIEPLFVDEDGSVCTIGAALPHSVLRDILRDGHERSSWLSLSHAGYFTYDTLDTVEALGFLQIGYDACFANGDHDDRLCEEFCQLVLSIDPRALTSLRGLVNDVPSGQDVIDNDLLTRRSCIVRSAGINAGRG